MASHDRKASRADRAAGCPGSERIGTQRSHLLGCARLGVLRLCMGGGPGRWPSRPGSSGRRRSATSSGRSFGSGLATLGPSRSSGSARRASASPRTAGRTLHGSRSGGWSGRRAPGREAGTRVPGAMGAPGARVPGRPERLSGSCSWRWAPAPSSPGAPQRAWPRRVPGARRARAAPRPARSAGRAIRPPRLNATSGAAEGSQRAHSAPGFFLAGAVPAGDGRSRSPRSVRGGRGVVPVGEAPSWPPSTICAPTVPGIWARARRRLRRASSSSTCSRPCWPNVRRVTAPAYRPASGGWPGR